MKISFCTTCMGRTHHLKQTLPRNIQDNLGPGMPQVEFVVVDYNSKDGMREWILNDPVLAPHLESGILQYVRYDAPEHFHMAHAKNMSHRLATGDILCNLDADNFTGPGFAQYLAGQFSRHQNIFVMPDSSLIQSLPIEERGFCGRISVSAKNFLQLGGYDETFQGWGGEDRDFILRALSAGLTPKTFKDSSFVKIIPHTHQERLANTQTGNTTEEVKKIEAYAPARRALLSRFKDLNDTLNSMRTTRKNSGGGLGEGAVKRGRDGVPLVLGRLNLGPEKRAYPLLGLIKFKIYRFK